MYMSRKTNFDLSASQVYINVNPYILKYLNNLKNKQILDVGCGDASLGKILEKKENKVTGIEMNPESARLARKNISNVIEEDALAAVKKLKKDFFDVVILSDFIEHIPYPDIFLKELKHLIRKGGFIIISVPNIANFTTRFDLLFGRFDYKKHGIMDSTHLRFFTKKTISKLVSAAGYKIKKLDITPVIPSFLERTMIERLVYWISKFCKGLLAYQFVILAEPVDNSRVLI